MFSTAASKRSACIGGEGKGIGWVGKVKSSRDEPEGHPADGIVNFFVNDIRVVKAAGLVVADPDANRVKGAEGNGPDVLPQTSA